MSVYFYYSAMNAGKSTYLLQAAHNYEQQGMQVLLLTPEVDDRWGTGLITSRIGLQRTAKTIRPEDDLLTIVKEEQEQQPLACVLVDEAHFLTAKQVEELTDVDDFLNVPVLTFGLRTDAFGNTFTGSERLLGLADKLIEQKTICHCGAKATMVVRFDAEGNPVRGGSQVAIGDSSYRSMCRLHYKEALGRTPKLLV